MQVCRPALGLGSWRRVLLLVSLSLLCGSTHSQAQDLAEAARQERARKAEQDAKTPHVYNDEDLKHDKILTPEDQERAAAQKKLKAPTSNHPENADALPLRPVEQTESLGEIARRYRKEKEEKEAAETAKKKIAPFPYRAPEPVLAAPKPEIAPLVRTSPETPVRKLRQAAPFVRPHVPGNANSARGRISPFQPRPLVSAPAAPPVLVVPGTPTSPIFVAPAAPRVAPRAGRSLALNTGTESEIKGVREIQVQREDSWWKLAGQYLGSGTRWRELRNLNPDVSEPAESLKEGSVIRVPETPELRNRSSQQDVVVKRGDTLWAIARTHLGHGSSWSCLSSVNPQITDFSRLTIGVVVHLPDREALQACEHSLFGSPAH